MATMARVTSQSDIESESDGASAHFFSDHDHHSDTDIEPEAAPSSGEQIVRLGHETLKTEFVGVRHKCSDGDEAAPSPAVVHQFRGIKYASVPMRFRTSVLYEAFARRTDATRNGPICPQIRNTRLESRLYGLPREIVPEKEELVQDEFECLNLTISTPDPTICAKYGLLPVMVWIHGGGNVTGCATDWIWDAASLVKTSIKIGQPIVAVGINFRLGLFGFGASELLREDNAAAGEAGVGNYAFNDQRAALQWIRKHISGFGGDPQNVTLFGSSWGAADIHAHLLSSANMEDVWGPPDSPGPLFHRAILQSGALVPSSSVVQDVNTASHLFGRVMSSLHVKTIDELRAVPASKLVTATGERVRPVDDGVFLRHDWKTLALPYSTSPDVPTSWRQDVIIGDVACESVLWAAPAKLWAADAVSRRARAIVQSVRKADAIMRAYDIVEGPGSPTREVPPPLHAATFDDDDDDDVRSSSSGGSGSDEGEDELAERVMELMNDVAFAWPVDVAARCAADSAFLYDEQPHPHQPSDGHLAVVSEKDEYYSSSSASPSPSPSSSVTNVSTSHRPPVRFPNAPFVYRYVFDQASPYTHSPHHGVDLLYLFGNVPFPSDPEFTPEENAEINWDHQRVREELQSRWIGFSWGERPWSPLTPQPPAGVARMSDQGIFATPMLGPVSSFPGGLQSSSGTASPVSASSRTSSFSSAFGNQNPFALHHQNHHHQHHHPDTQNIQNTQNKTADSSGSPTLPHQYLQPPHQHQHHHHSHHPHHHQHGFHPHLPPYQLHGGATLYGPSNPPPISISAADKVFVFGPEGETGARSAAIFAGRRRVHAWRSALAPLGLAMAQKVGVELGNGPPKGGAGGGGFALGNFMSGIRI